jgi:predicted MPP superfamily phosphohydrolase
VRISQEASAAVGAGLHHLFWINPDPSHDETYRSAEMHFLLEEYARPTWESNPRKPKLEWLVGKQREYWSGRYDAILNEYEFGFRQAPSAATRTEVLHPVFIHEAKPSLKIGHLTDLHIDTRWDAYESNLKSQRKAAAGKYYNWNRACEKLYRQAKQRCDVLLLTGDLIDYGRTYNEIGPLGEKGSYWRDRNWFYFYETIAGGMKYTHPAYTILGNHDWRINPYPPFAPGAPSLEELNIAKDDLIAAHGVGHDAGKDYDPLDGKQFGEGFWKKVVVRKGSLNVADTPIETSIDSVAWYLLLINPFLDYTCPLPGGYSLTMLDWAEKERVDLHVIAGGIDFGPTILLPNTHGGPMALDAITPHQRWLVEQVADWHIGPKILGIHAPLLGPWPHWPNDQLPTGRLKFTREDAYAPFRQQRPDETEQRYTERLRFARGATETNRTTRDAQGHETTTRIYEHPTKAIRLSPDDPEGQEADYGGVVRQRADLVKLLRKSKFQLVFSGHIHRSNLLVIDVEQMVAVPGKSEKQISDYHGQWLMKSVTEQAALTAKGPLFVNTTSAGPPGHNYASRGVYKRAPSGYTEVTLAKDGSLQLIESRTASQPVVQVYEPVVVR